MRRLLMIMAVALLTATLLSGCLFRGAEALYVLPRLSEDYTNLQDELEALVSGDLEYATPKSGDNTQAIQFRDLDGDGQAEVLVFFRDDSAGDGKPLRIWIYHKTDQGLYQAIAEISGEGSAFHSVEYVELDNDGVTELVVNYQISDQVYVLSVYSLPDFNISQMMQAGCSSYAVTDLDEDGIHELMLFQLDSTGEEGNRAQWYTLTRGTLTLSDTAALSDDLLYILRTRSGSLTEGQAAVYVTGTCGSSDQLVTDILTLEEGALTNLTLDTSTGNSTATLRENSGDNIFVMDIDGDGVCEVPLVTRLSGQDSQVWQVRWTQFHADGSFETVCTALCAPEVGDGWYILLPDSFWNRFSGNLTAKYTQALSYNEVVIALYDTSDLQEAENSSQNTQGTLLLSIYTISGANRVVRSQLTGRYTLYSGSETVYAFSLTTDSGLTQAQITEGFHLVPTSWSD